VRILMISAGCPLPADNGAKRRILASAVCLSQRHHVTLISLREDGSGSELDSDGNDVPWRQVIVDMPTRGRLITALKAFLSTKSYAQVKYWNKNFQSMLVNLTAAQQFDAIWVHQLCMARYVEHILLRYGGGRRQNLPLIVLDQHNVDELYFKSFLIAKANIAWKLYAFLEVLKAIRLQKKWYPLFDVILCVAPEDLRTTANYVSGNTEIWCTPNGVDLDYFKPCEQAHFSEIQPVLVFGGSLDVTMNQDAVIWFSTKILPLIERHLPEIQFLIVGRQPPPEIQRLSKSERIMVTGTVADVRNYYRQAAVFVVPLRIGGGTKLKVLEAMAMALPVVTTTVGAQGLNVESGRHLFVADNPDDFAGRVLELLKDRKKAAQIGAAARRFVEQKYGWEAIIGDADHRLTRLFYK